MKSVKNELLFQNPDTTESISIIITEYNLLIRDIAEKIIKKFNLKSPPLFFTIFKENPIENHYLEEDDKLLDVIEKKLDPKVPIWWRSTDIDQSIIYKLRTDRFIKSGYNFDVIKNTTIMITGIGLLGSEIALHTATIGFKNIKIVDYGSVDWFNIYRQPLYKKSDVFNKKVVIGIKNLEEMGGVHINGLDIEIPNFNSLGKNKNTIKQIIEKIEKMVFESDLIITSLDSFSARMLLQILALSHNKILINTAAGLIGGVIQIVRPNQDPCIGCGTFIDRSQEIGACTLSSFGTPKVIAGFCIDIIMDLLEKRDIRFNHLKLFPNYKIETKFFHKADDCPFCGENGIIDEYKNNNKDIIIDWLTDES